MNAPARRVQRPPAGRRPDRPDRGRRGGRAARLGGEGARRERARCRRRRVRVEVRAGRPRLDRRLRRRLRHEPRRRAAGAAAPRHQQDQPAPTICSASDLRLPRRGAARHRVGLAAAPAHAPGGRLRGLRDRVDGGVESERAPPGRRWARASRSRLFECVPARRKFLKSGHHGVGPRRGLAGALRAGASRGALRRAARRPTRARPGPRREPLDRDRRGASARARRGGHGARGARGEGAHVVGLRLPARPPPRPARASTVREPAPVRDRCCSTRCWTVYRDLLPTRSLSRRRCSS